MAVNERMSTRDVAAQGQPSLVSTADMWTTPLGPDGTPYAYIEALRDELEDTRIGWSDAQGGFWVVGGYDEAVQVFLNTEAFSNSVTSLPHYETAGIRLVVGEQDDPEHRKYRRLVAPAFSPKGATGVARHADLLTRVTNDLIDGFIADGRVDIAARFTEEIPVIVTAMILDFPPSSEDNTVFGQRRSPTCSTPIRSAPRS